jgi:hypothetical protein
MKHRKQLVPWIVIALVAAPCSAPLTYAVESTETSVAPSTTPPAGPLVSPVDLGADWWKGDSATGSPFVTHPAFRLEPVAESPASPSLGRQVALLSETWAETNLAVQEAAPAEGGDEWEDQGGWSKAGKIMTIVGGIVVASGIIMIVAAPDETQVSDSDVSIDWQTTGIVWSAAGAVVLIIGLIKH